MSDSKFDKLYEKLTDIEVTLARNTTSLEEHMRRTSALEERQDMLAAELEDSREKSDSRYRTILLEIKKTVRPIERHISFMKGAFWAIGIVGAVLLGAHEMGILDKLFGHS